MKDFNEFWDTLTDDDWQKIIDDTNAALSDDSVKEKPYFEKLGLSVSLTSILTVKFILKKYHEWLSSQSD